MNLRELSKEIMCKVMFAGCVILATYPLLVLLIIYVRYKFSGR